MLGKLLKYDLKWIYKVLIFLYAAGIIFALIGRGLTSIENSMILNTIGRITVGIAIGLFISSLINCIMRSWSRLLRNLYKDEAYLTHTLPVEKKTIYLSKVLAGLITMTTTILIMVIGIAICYYSKENFAALKSALASVAVMYESSFNEFVIASFFTMALELFFILMIGYTGIIFGYKSNRNKMLTSIILGFIFYMVTQIISLLVMFIAALFDDGIMNLFKTTDKIDINSLKTIFIVFMTLYVVYVITYYIIGRIKLKKGVDVD